MKVRREAAASVIHGAKFAGPWQPGDAIAWYDRLDADGDWVVSVMWTHRPPPDPQWGWYSCDDAGKREHVGYATRDAAMAAADAWARSAGWTLGDPR